MTFFNLLFTSIPPMVVGVSEKDIDEEALMNTPAAYKNFVNNPIFTQRKFIWEIVIALVHGMGKCACMK